MKVSVQWWSTYLRDFHISHGDLLIMIFIDKIQVQVQFYLHLRPSKMKISLSYYKWDDYTEAAYWRRTSRVIEILSCCKPFQKFWAISFYIQLQVINGSVEFPYVLFYTTTGYFPFPDRINSPWSDGRTVFAAVFVVVGWFEMRSRDWPNPRPVAFFRLLAHHD